MQLTGEISAISPIIKGTSSKGNAYMLLNFVLEFNDPVTGEQSYILMDLFGKNAIEKYDLHIDDNVTVDFNCSAASYNNRWYNHLRVTNLTKLQSSFDSPANNYVDSPNNNFGKREPDVPDSFADAWKEAARRKKEQPKEPEVVSPDMDDLPF